MPTNNHERPWAARARELEPKEGPYCDYCAWEEYMNRQDETLPESSETIMDTLDQTQRAYLYSWMSELAEPCEAPDVPVIVEESHV